MPRQQARQTDILVAWSHILDINYWAIFAIARDIVTQLPSDTSATNFRFGCPGTY